MTMSPFPIVGIGASAGGLDAFKQIFPAMPDSPGMAFVFIQHLDPTHESLMVDLLRRHTEMNIIQVEDKMDVKENHIYLIPPNREMSIYNRVLHLSLSKERRGLRTPIDVFFRTLAEDQHERAIGIILSGTGSDGTLGFKAIKDAGGLVMVQDPTTAQYDAMPASAIASGVVDFILPVEEMPDLLVKYVQHSYVKGSLKEQPIEEQQSDELSDVLAILYAQTRRSFQYYKNNTITRRIKRRMGLRQIERMQDYVRYLQDNSHEVQALFKDLLIGVTGFFREPDSWRELEQQVIKPLVAEMNPEKPLRVWVPGCSTGEETYSIGMLLFEHLASTQHRPNIQIFATDIDKDALEIARMGRYPESIAADMSSERLQKFFEKEKPFYQVSEKLRDSIVFSEQDLIGDPPFSKLDLISCCNLLIYLKQEMQKKVISLFHFALREGGYLSLGTSESIGQYYDLFEIVSKKWRIYRRIGPTRRGEVNFPIIVAGKSLNKPSDHHNFTCLRQHTKISDIAQRALLKKYAPASVLINRKYEILYYFGPTVEYLHYPTGEPSIDLFTILREGLTIRIRGAVHKAVRENEIVTISRARVTRKGIYYPITVTVEPIKDLEDAEGLLLVSFWDEPEKQVVSSDDTEITDSEDSLVKQLEYDLKVTREELQNTIEDMESSNEELKASNEEVMSMNEEIQSSNEELETSKEELQSLNEELHTVNNQLQEKVDELTVANNDLQNLINSTGIATIFLDLKLRIKRFTPMIKALFNLIPTDIGRSIKDISRKFNDVELHNDAEAVLDTLEISQKPVLSDDGRWFLRKILPYRTHDNHIEGIVVLFSDITEIKEQETEHQRKEQRLGIAVKASGAGIYELAVPKKEVHHTERCAEILGYKPQELPPQPQFMNWLLAQIHPDDRNQWQQAYADFIAGHSANYSIDVRIQHKSGKWLYVKNLITAVAHDDNAQVTHLIGVMLDITEQKQIELKHKS